MRVLVVEDNAINQKVAVRMLERLGCRVDVAGNGREALKVVATLPYDMVLMDCQMVEMDGYEATAEIRRLEGTNKHTPIIAMTANTMHGEREHCLAVGMDDYIAKPILIQHLRQMLEKWLPWQKADNEQKWETVSHELTNVIVDEQMLDNFMTLEDEGEDMLEDVVKLYLNDVSLDIASLRQALEERDTETVRKISHHIKGSSAQVGAMQMQAIFADMEKIGPVGKVYDVDGIMKKLQVAFSAAKEALERYLDERCVEKGQL
jgi:CheY-like chemotaxis protein/HPt (histidine-containing phosphotransfer) domain-containing protein